MRTADWLLLILLSALWGATFFFVAVALQALPPLTLVTARVALAATLLAPLALVSGYRLPGSLSAWRSYAVLALLNNVTPFTLMSYGQTHIASALAAVLNATTPLFTLLLARMFAGEALSVSKLGGIGLGIAGVAVLMGPAAARLDGASAIGMLAILTGALSYGFAALWMRRLRGTPPLVSAAAQLMCSTVMLAPVAAYLDRFWTLPPPGTTAIAAVLGLAIFSTALAYVVFFRINATAGPTNVMLVTLLIPVTATALGVLILGEDLAPNQVAGALIIASGLIVIDGRLLAWVARRQARTA
jgi:drug/metabolite transporter (DMT)-like permease